jgi:hypothetical protein
MKAPLAALLLLTMTGISPTVAHAQRTTLDRCISVLANDFIRFVERTSECSAKCEDRVRKGQLAEDTSCTLPSEDPSTQICLLRAKERITGSRAAARLACTDREIDLFFGGTFTCFGQNETVDEVTNCLWAQGEFFANDLLRQVYRPKFTIQ